MAVGEIEIFEYFASLYFAYFAVIKSASIRVISGKKKKEDLPQIAQIAAEKIREQFLNVL